METVDWSDCTLVEVLPGKVGGVLCSKIPACLWQPSPATTTPSLMRDRHHTRSWLKLSTVTRKLVSTPSKLSSTTERRIGFMLNFEGVFRRGRTTPAGEASASIRNSNRSEHAMGRGKKRSLAQAHRERQKGLPQEAWWLAYEAGLGVVIGCCLDGAIQRRFN